MFILTQIGIKAEWRAHHGRLVLFLGNKNTSPLISVQALILPPSHLKMELSLVPDTIPPRAQVTCHFVTKWIKAEYTILLLLSFNALFQLPKMGIRMGEGYV